jgi:hypothetical protein
MLGAVVMQHFRASPRQVLVPLSSAPSQHARQVGHDCAIAQIRRINLSSSIAASLSSIPSTEPIAAAHPLLLLLLLPLPHYHQCQRSQHINNDNDNTGSCILTLSRGR